ncbi:MAG: VOC family protein, partial [Chloroflexi bacterium]
MLLGIDHLVIAVAVPDDATAQLEQELGLTSAGGGRHDTLGTFNRLVWLGDSYL